MAKYLDYETAKEFFGFRVKLLHV